MAKKKRSKQKYIGPLKGKVWVNSKRYGGHYRDLPTAEHSKKKQEVIDRNNKRTKFLSNLASQLNKVMSEYGPNFKPTDFYHTLLSPFRKEPLNNRFMLLRHLNGMEVNPKYPSSKLGTCIASVTSLKNKLVVTLNLKSHPQPGKHNANCYYYDLNMVTWTKRDTPPQHSQISTDWIKLNDAMNEYSFEFPIPAGTVHWLLCLHKRLGVKEVEVEARAAESMHIAGVGTLDKKDIGLLNKREKEIEEERKKRIKKPAKKKVRIGPKRKS